MGKGWDLLLLRTRQVFNEHMQSVIDAMRSNPLDKDWEPTPVTDEMLVELIEAADRGEPLTPDPAYRAATFVVTDRIRALTGMSSRFSW